MTKVLIRLLNDHKNSKLQEILNSDTVPRELDRCIGEIRLIENLLDPESFFENEIDEV